ncbi:MAG: hypothetical protein N3D18_09160 [Roseococcus sp.]|nr:hypothetical protein [Roseococcus sp.]
MAKTTDVEQKQRSVYLMARAKALRAEISALRTEQKEVTAKLQGMAERSSPEARALRQRRIYLRLRPAEARAELEKVLAERAALQAAKA